MSDKPGKKHSVTDRFPVPPITDRFAEPSVTDRFEKPGVTDIFNEFQSPSHDLMSILSLKKGDLVKDRFRIDDPIGAEGEADVYRGMDEQTGQIVALKFYRYKIVPKESVLEQLSNLDHPDIVSLKDFGTWAGRFYEVMEFCEGGKLVDYAPIREDELRSYIKEIVSGLNYCHDQGVVHRDIKPGNLFFRFRGKKDLVIADFGVSSALKEGEKERVSGTFHHTPDYVAPELLFHKVVSPKTDYYSLGITIIHLLTGRSPFNEMEVPSIYAAHGSGRIPVSESISPEFRQFIKGLTQLRPENRWGYKQVQCWLRGEPILTDDGLLWREDLYAGKEHSYQGYPKARNPIELAAALDKFDAAKQLFRGDIRRWIFDHFDPALGERIEAIQENYSDRPALGVHKLRHLLDPSQPLIINGYKVYEIDDLISLLQTNDEHVLKALEDALWGEFIECWIDATNVVQEKDMLLKVVQSIREKLKNRHRRLGIFALLWHLQPSLPFPFGSNKAATPEELAALIDKDENSKKLGLEIMTNGWLRTWLTTTGKMSDPEAFDEIANKTNSGFQRDLERNLETVLHLLNPKLPRPKLTSDQDMIDLDKISTESEKIFSIKFWNSGRGFLSGTVSLQGNGGGFAINQMVIEGGPLTVNVTIKPLGVPAGSRQNTTVIADTNGGKIEIPVTYKVSAPIWKMIGRSVLAGSLFGGVLGFLRALVGSANPEFKSYTLNWMNWDYINRHTDQWYLAFLGIVFAGIVGGSIYYLASMMNAKK